MVMRDFLHGLESKIVPEVPVHRVPGFLATGGTRCLSSRVPGYGARRYPGRYLPPGTCTWADGQTRTGIPGTRYGCSHLAPGRNLPGYQGGRVPGYPGTSPTGERHSRTQVRAVYP
eukprot:2797542-Rhodomonas_salina.1